MVFSSTTFLAVFLPLVLLGYYILRPRFRNVFLLVASLAFYAWGEPKFVFMLILSILFNYLLALGIHSSKKHNWKKCLLVCAVAFNIGILLAFKYTNFITRSLFVFWPAIPLTSIALPIGISFFTFQALSYTIDVYRGEKVQKNPLNLGLYISFFPQLIAGPIVRYNTISEQLNSRDESWTLFSDGVERFLIGLFKKILLANNIAVVADCAFSALPADISISFAWLGALAYTFQIYFDFSGYSDMAIGLGKMFGFQFEENFNYPYIASNITDFWRRWHISLSSWFRDYVYIPLGGSRVGSDWKLVRNLFVVWLLTGIWHGANWTFILWGLLYFALLVLEKYVIKPQNFRKGFAKASYRMLTFIAVMFCWVIFRSDNLSFAAHYIQSMFGLNGNSWLGPDAIFYSREYLIVFLLSAVCCTPSVKKLGFVLEERCKPGIIGALKIFAFVALFIISLSYLAMGAHNPFIYFNF